MNRGKNTVEYWNEKHKVEYELYEEYDFSKFETNPLSYHVVAANIIRENHPDIINKSLLEIGCAAGYFSSYLKRYVIPNWKIDAWDFSPSAINAAKDKNKDLSGLNFYIRDFILNPVDVDYGIICSFETIEHVEEGTNYKIIDNWIEHCEYLILSTVDTEDDCGGEHISHYKIHTFKEKGYNVVWSNFLTPIYMPNGIYHYFINIIKGKLCR